MSKTIVAALAVSLGVLAAVPPSEATLAEVGGYVCATTYTRQNNVAFGQGFVRVRLYTEPFCEGTFVVEVTHIGAGASILGYQTDLPERLSLFERAHTAAIAGKRASYFVDLPAGGVIHTTYRAD